MDNIYKINKYGLPLLEIVCVMLTRLTFSVAFVLLAIKQENNFIGTLKDLEGCFLGQMCSLK